MKLRYSDAGDGESADEGDRTSIKEMKSTDQIIVVQQKGNDSEIYEIWYGNGLEFTIIEGPKTTIPYHQQIMKNDSFKSGEFDTGFLEKFDYKP